MLFGASYVRMVTMILAVPIGEHAPQIWFGAFLLLLGIGAIAAFGRRLTCGVLLGALAFIAIGATLIIVALTVG